MKTTKLYPLQFEPQYQYRLWGGNNFSTLFKRAIPGKQLGESWEICGLKEKPSIVSNGVFKGESILSLMEQFPKALLGESVLNHSDWVPVCSSCDVLDTLSWKEAPQNEMQTSTGIEMLPLLMGANQEPMDEGDLIKIDEPVTDQSQS